MIDLATPETVEAVFGREINEAVDIAEAHIDRVLDRPGGDPVEIIRYVDGVGMDFVQHAALMRVLDNHGVLDAYKGLPDTSDASIVAYTESDINDTTLATFRSRRTRGIVLIVGDSVGEDEENPGRAIYGQVLKARKSYT